MKRGAGAAHLAEVLELRLFHSAIVPSVTFVLSNILVLCGSERLVGDIAES